jgi:hypothetical protein
VPTFCRHNRFIERCPICSSTLPGADGSDGGEQRRSRAARGERATAGASGSSGAATRRRARGADGVRVLRHERASADGYSNALLPGVHASADAERLAAEIAFSAARLQLLESDPPGVYAAVRALANEDADAAARACFLIAYLSPSEDEDAFGAIRAAMADPARVLSDLEPAQLGPRTSHDPARGTETLDAYERLVRQAGGARAAFVGEESWTRTRRFERLFERLALRGLTRAARYELLVLLGALGGYELEADSLHLGVARGAATNDATMLAAKRVFAIGDAIHLERRAAALAEALAVEVGALELALWNFFSPQRATLGFAADLRDEDVYALARETLSL